MNLRNAAQQALEALEKCAMTIDWEWGDCRDLEEMRETGKYTDETTPAITALRAALAEPEQEPVAVVALDTSRPFVGGTYNGQPIPWTQAPASKTVMMFKDLPLNTPLYTAPTPRKPLTDEEIEDAYSKASMPSDHYPHDELVSFARAIEKAHGITGETK